MNKKEKDLLLRDLCGRLPYEVILVAPNGKTVYQTDGNTGAELLVEEGWKPYLRPMSSMTEEEANEFETISEGLFTNEAPEQIWGEVIDWLNKNMFDYRGLIPMNLALEAPEGMYK